MGEHVSTRENHVERGARVASPRARKVLRASRAHMLVHATVPGKKEKLVVV